MSRKTTTSLQKTTDSKEDTEGREESIADKDINRTLDPSPLTPPIKEPKVALFSFYRSPSQKLDQSQYKPEQHKEHFKFSSLKEQTPASTTATCGSPFYRSVNRTTPGFLSTSPYGVQTPPSNSTNFPWHHPVIESGSLENHVTPGFVSTSPYHAQTPSSTSTTVAHHVPVIKYVSLENGATPGFVSTSQNDLQPSASTFTNLEHYPNSITSVSSEILVPTGFVYRHHEPIPTSTTLACEVFPHAHSLEKCVPTKETEQSMKLEPLQHGTFSSSNLPSSTVHLSTLTSPLPQHKDINLHGNISNCKPERIIIYSKSLSDSLPPSTSDSTVSDHLQPSLFYPVYSHRTCGKVDGPLFHLKDELIKTTGTSKGFRPAEFSVVTGDFQDEQKQPQKIFPEGYDKITSLSHPASSVRTPLSLHLLASSSSRLHEPFIGKSDLNPLLPLGSSNFNKRRRNHDHGHSKVLPSPTVLNQSWSRDESFHRSAGFPESRPFLLSDSLNLHQGLKPKRIKKQTIEVTDDRGPTISRSTHTAHPPCSQFSISPLTGPSECSNEERLKEEETVVSVFQKESIQGVDPNVSGEEDPPIITERLSVTLILPPNFHLYSCSTDSCCLTRSHSLSSLSKIPKKNLTRASSLPEMRLKEFTPDITADDFNDESCLFQCSSAGLYQCSVTGLVFVMQAEGDVVYRTVPWNRRLLAQHHKKPAGPLFDIKCQQQSVCQLHLPHCEVISTGGGQFLQVAHVNDEGIEFITPHQITETHVVINITGFSGYGNVKDEDSPCDPVRALVLLFYKPPVDPDLTSFLSVLLVPKNVVLRDVLHSRKKLVGHERYIETSPHCKLHPKQVYTLSAVPEDYSFLVQPTEAEFDEESYDNYFPSFQVILEKIMKTIMMTLTDSTSSHNVWQRQVYLSSSGVKKCRGQKPLNLSPNDRLFNVRSCFIDGISGPVLNSLLDKLLEKKVITDAEREEADVMQNRSSRARFVIDTVRKKGEAAGSQMIKSLSEIDSFFCKSLGLI